MMYYYILRCLRLVPSTSPGKKRTSDRLRARPPDPASAGGPKSGARLHAPGARVPSVSSRTFHASFLRLARPTFRAAASNRSHLMRLLCAIARFSRQVPSPICSAFPSGFHARRALRQRCTLAPPAFLRCVFLLGSPRPCLFASPWTGWVHSSAYMISVAGRSSSAFPCLMLLGLCSRP